MVINSKAFGEIEIDEKKIIRFASGLPGFPNTTEYIVLTENNEDEAVSSFLWLQSTKEPDVAFAVLNTMMVYEDYSPLIDRSELFGMENSKEADMLVYNIVVIPNDPAKTTVNLKAPVLIDTKHHIGKQVIASNEEYSIRHLLTEPIPQKVGV